MRKQNLKSKKAKLNFYVCQVDVIVIKFYVNVTNKNDKKLK